MSPAQVPATISLGSRVIVTVGLAKGVCGVVTARWGTFGRREGAVRMWQVRSQDLVGLRILREDHLEVLPEAGQ